MAHPEAAASNRAAPDPAHDPVAAAQAGGYARLWRGFMTARLSLGTALLAMQLLLQAIGQGVGQAAMAICVAYFLATLATRLMTRPLRLGRNFDPPWLSTIGVDIAAFFALQFLQEHGGFNYTPLLALPVLLASVLGSLPLALGTAAGVTLLLLAQALGLALRAPPEMTPVLAQTALTGAGYLLIALLSNQLAVRLAQEEQRSLQSEHAMQLQREVNALVIESMADGVLVLDAAGRVWAANPAAQYFLGRDAAPLALPFEIAAEPAWATLARLAAASIASGRSQSANVVLVRPDTGPLRVLVRSRLAAASGGTGAAMCVLFMQDQREAEARLRTEKLASMGRLSTAVAHEIRNPLAAIVQANALLDEEVEAPHLRHLTQLVQQNAGRLERIVDDVLDVSRVPGSAADAPAPIPLHAHVQRICDDWSQHAGASAFLDVRLVAGEPQVVFDDEHLRRVLVNLLDNARRHASRDADAIVVSTAQAPHGRWQLGVWSDGAPMDASVQRHLFEPFFSSESRSTGLGLYICRELCERHGATIGFERCSLPTRRGPQEGNEFRISFARADGGAGDAGGSDRMAPTPWQQQSL